MDSTNDYNESNYKNQLNNSIEETITIKQNKIEDNNKRLLTIGKCSRFYLYIVGSACCKFLSSMILGYKDKNIGLFGFSPIFYSYHNIQFLLTYLSYIIFGIIIHFFLKGTEKKIDNKKFEIIIKKSQKLMSNPKKTYLQLFLICFCYGAYLELKTLLYSLGFNFLHLWPFEGIFTFLLMKKYFMVDIYKHHKSSIIFALITGTLFHLVASFVPSDDTGLNSYQNFEKNYGNYFYCFCIMSVFIIMTFGYSFSICFSKVLVQNKFISTHILIIFIGITGLIVNTISAIILYYINSKNNIEDYFDELKSCDKDYKFYIEIFLIYPIYIFIRFTEIYLEFLTIYYLNPIHDLIINNISFTLIKFVSFIINNFSNILYFLFSELSENFVLIGYIVHLEILELHFCGLSDDIKKIIISKAESESSILNIERIRTLSEIYNNNEEEEAEEKEDSHYYAIEMIAKT